MIVPGCLTRAAPLLGVPVMTMRRGVSLERGVETSSSRDVALFHHGARGTMPIRLEGAAVLAPGDRLNDCFHSDGARI